MSKPALLISLSMTITIGAGSAIAEESPPPPLSESKRLIDRADERVSVMDNGLTVILKGHRTAPTVSVQMYCRTGSIYEQEYLGCGLSHLFEHLLHGGATTTRTEEQARTILDQLGGNSNAYTSYDKTCYYINTKREDSERAIELLADWITRPTFPQGAFDREWEVVQRELERHVDDPTRQLYYLINETMYLEHPVRYPVIGYKPVVQSLTKEDIVGYYHRMYVPDNIVVSIAGDIDLDRTLAVVAKQFASFTRRPLPTIVLPAEPEMATPRYATKQMKVQAAILTLAWPSIHLTHPDLYALDVLSYILTQGDSSRLVRTIRDEGLVYGIDSFSWTPEWARGTFVIMARLDPNKLGESKAAVAEQIAALQGDLITAQELNQAKQQKAAEHVFASQTAEDVASMMARDYLSTGDVHFSQAYVDNIQKVTAEQIREMARKYLVPDRLGTITILPEGYQSASAEEQATGKPDPVRLIKLDNGLRCLIRRDPTTPLVSIQSFSLGGVAYEDESTNGLSRLAAILAPRGTATRTAQQIARFFDARGGDFSGASGNNTTYFQAQVLDADFADAVEVFADVVCHPSFPEADLEVFRARQLDAIRRINEHWRSELFSYFRSRFFENSPYRFETVGSEEVVAKATREDVERFYRQRVTGPQTVVAIFGDVDAGQAETLVRKHFGGMSADPPPALEIADEPARTAPRLYVKRKSPDRQAAGICVGFRGMKLTDVEDTIPVKVLDTIISGYRLPTGWLHEALRGGDRSYVYEVHAVNFPGLLPGYFQIYAGCQPDQVSEVYRIITEQLDRARAGEFTAEELARAKTMILTTELMANQTNGDRAMRATLDELYGLGYDHGDKLDERIKAVTLDDVKRMATKYLTIPVVTVVTPAPDKVKLGIEPTAVDQDAPTDKQQGKP